MAMFWHTLTTDVQAPCSCCLKFCLYWVEGSPRASFLHYCMQFWALMQATVKRLPKAPKCTDIGRALTCIDTALIGGDSREHRRLIKVGRIHERTSLHKPIRQTEQHGLGNLILLWLQLNSFDWIPYITFLIRFGCIWLTLKPNKRFPTEVIELQNYRMIIEVDMVAKYLTFQLTMRYRFIFQGLITKCWVFLSRYFGFLHSSEPGIWFNWADFSYFSVSLFTRLIRWILILLPWSL